MAGWYSRASRSIRDAFGRCSSKTGAYRSSNLGISQNQVNHLKNNNALGNGKMEGMLENMQRDSPFVDGRKVGLFKLWLQEWRSGRSKLMLPHLIFSWPIFARYFGGDVVDAVYRRIGTAHYTGRRRYLLLKCSHEKEIGDVNKSKFEGKIVAPHHPYCIKVQKIGREIVEVAKSQAAHAKEFEWEFFVIDDPTTVNSFALLGGKVYVYSGFLEKFQKDKEIAAVIAHEVGHIVAGHLAEHLTEAGILHFVLGLRLPAFYNPRWELEADYIGLILMASAGYDPRVVPPMLKTQDDHTHHRGSVMMGIGGAGADDFPMEDLSEEARALLLQDISGETRAQHLLQPEVMEKALSIYKEVLAGRGIEVR